MIADRYAFSGIAFSAAKVRSWPCMWGRVLICQGLPFEFCLQSDAGLPLPDITLFFTLAPEEAAARGSYGEERYENVELQSRVRAQFDVVQKEVVRRHGNGRWTTVDAGGSPDEVEARVWGAVSSSEAGPARRLWIST